MKYSAMGSYNDIEGASRLLIQINVLIAIIVIPLLLIFTWIVKSVIRRRPSQFHIFLIGTAIRYLARTFPVFTNALWAYFNLQLDCCKGVSTCYTDGGATWRDSVALRTPKTMHVASCNQDGLSCFAYNTVAFINRVMELIGVQF